MICIAWLQWLPFKHYSNWMLNYHDGLSQMCWHIGNQTKWWWLK